MDIREGVCPRIKRRNRQRICEFQAESDRQGGSGVLRRRQLSARAAEAEGVGKGIVCWNGGRLKRVWIKKEIVSDRDATINTPIGYVVDA